MNNINQHSANVVRKKKRPKTTILHTMMLYHFI